MVFICTFRFDIDFNEENKTLSVTPRKSENQSGKQKNLSNGEVGDQPREVKQGKTESKQTNTGNTFSLTHNVYTCAFERDFYKLVSDQLSGNMQIFL